MNPEPLRKSTGVRRVIAGAGAAIAVGVVGVVWLIGEADSSAATGESTLPSPAIDEPRFAIAPPAAASGLDIPARDESPGEMQVCGGAWVKLGADGLPNMEEFANILAQATNEVGTTGIAAMSASGSPRAQAAALYLRLGLADLHALTGGGCNTGECLRSRDASKTESEGHRDALARLAQDSSDPQIYAWAYRTCRSAKGSPQGACSFINVGQWTYLDPLLADPWIAAAAEAHLGKDNAGVADAMFHVAHAERVDLGFAALAAEILNHVPTGDETVLGLFGLLAQASGIEASRFAGLVPVSEYCSDKELVDSNRREACERIATVMTDRSTNTYPRFLGSELGKRLGWSSERIEALDRERDAGQAAVEQRSEQAAARPQACEAFRFEVDRVRDITRWGELETNRRQIAATGRTPSELAAQSRRRRAESEANAARAVTAASGAAGAAASATSVALKGAGTGP